jgi:hypothetical protein
VGSGGATAVNPDADPDPVDAFVDVREPPPRCGGVSDSQICWYLGKSGESCATTCATRGGSSPQAAAHVGNGSQGGSAQECSRLLSLLGISGSVLSATADEGVGCAVALGLHWYVTSPAYSDNARLASVQVVCGCLR